MAASRSHEIPAVFFNVTNLREILHFQLSGYAFGLLNLRVLFLLGSGFQPGLYPLYRRYARGSADIFVSYQPVQNRHFPLNGAFRLPQQ